MRKLILKCQLGLGDIVVLTAAVRDLHQLYPGKFITDVRTSYPEVWENNPYISPLDERERNVSIVECAFPLIERSNREPYHVIHGFIQFLNDRLGLQIRPTAFHGDFHISREEKSWRSQVDEIVGHDIPFWIVGAGGKYDYTAKWWETKRYQEVVDYFRGKILFVQVGEIGHHHPRLEGVLDLRGKTSVRELVRLVYHAQGVLCPVTSLMHLAAAVEVRGASEPNRPCVVVAGGREPYHWEAYPFHQFIHTVGALPCCADGGCWRSRTVPLNDGHELDAPKHLCVDVVGSLPHCMHMITSEEVIRRMEFYFEGGAVKHLSPRQVRTAKTAISRQEPNSYDEILTRHTARRAADQFIEKIPAYPSGFAGRGIVICGGGRYFPCAWVCINMLRHLGCSLPIQLWYLGKKELEPWMEALLAPFQVQCVNAAKVLKQHPMRILGGWELKPYAILHCPFKEVLLLDADNLPLINPDFLFETGQFRKRGAVFWPDQGQLEADRPIWRICGVPYRNEPDFESGQILVDKERCWKALRLSLWYNDHSDFYYEHIHGDKDTFHLAFRRLNQPYAMPKRRPHVLQGTMCQHDFAGRRIFQHRCAHKWALFRANKRIKGFRQEKRCLAFLSELEKRWNPKTLVYRADHSSPKPLARFLNRSDPLRVKESVSLVTLYDQEFAEIARITTARMRQYAHRHGYELICHDRLLDKSRPPAWNKILAVLEALRSGPSRWVFWCDADVLIGNIRRRVEDFIPEGVDLVFTSDCNGLNSGVFLARRCPRSLKFFEAVYTLGEVSYDQGGRPDTWEQNTIQHVFANFAELQKGVAVLPPYEMSADLSRFQKGDFLLHLMGLSAEQKLEALRRIHNPVFSGKYDTL